MPRDFTKYQFNGHQYGKGRLVLAVVKEFAAKQHPTFEQLNQAFPVEVQGRRGIFCTDNEFNEKLKVSDDVTKRFFTKEEEKLEVDGQKVLVSTQWGEGNIGQFLERAKALGFKIKKVSAELTDEDIIEQFLHNQAFERNYKNWPDDVLISFCQLMRHANDAGLDIFTVNMDAGGAIRIGRKENDKEKAAAVLETLEPQTTNIRFKKKHLTSVTLSEFIGSNSLHSFAQRYPLNRKPYWPTDYNGKSLPMTNARIWKVSHSPNSIDANNRAWLEENSLLAVHRNTGNGSIPCFEQMSEGDIVSLGYGNQVARLVRVISSIETQPDSPLGAEWLLRKYAPIKSLDKPVKYEGKHKRWSPRFNGTCWEVPKHEYWMFEQEILQPYYQLSLEDLGLEVSQLNKPEQHSESAEAMDKTPLNQILYGPPGTGKTYHSIHAAVKAAEPDAYRELGIDEHQGASAAQRSALTELYQELYDEGRIRFVTFHQSYGYEEFVEGLKASSDGGNISYDVEDGVFKSIADEAKKYQKPKEAQLQYSFDKAWQMFIELLAEKDSVEVKMSKATFKVFDFNDSRIFFEKTSGSKNHTLSISTLKAIFEDRREYNSGLGVYYRPLAKFLKELAEPEHMPEVGRKNFVLIIDEINRGNISKIFGELITLIEPSKRSGQAETVEVTLPYSGKSGEPFSVPDNLYIIGTMNTADRSLALMDTALRRRFDFVEMMPDYKALHDDEGLPYTIESDDYNINLAQLLKTLNKRISALYDREHELGHAFLMPVVQKIRALEHVAALDELAKCFKNKIIPLLAEYFFEDWQKIRLVLGDNQKSSPYQLIRQSDLDFEGLFGDSDEVRELSDEAKEYELITHDNQLWLDALTYIAMYEPTKVTG